MVDRLESCFYKWQDALRADEYYVERTRELEQQVRHYDDRISETRQMLERDCAHRGGVSKGGGMLSEGWEARKYWRLYQVRLLV